MLPFLRRLAISMTNKDYKWMFLMYGLMQSLSIIEFLIWKGEIAHNNDFSFFILANYIFYPLTGYYIDQRLKEEKFTRNNAFVLVIISIISILISCFMTHYRCTIFNSWTESTCQTFFNTLIFIPAIMVYYISKMWFMNHKLNEKVCKIIATLGGTTFGIYLIEQICRKETHQIFIWLRPYIHTLPACWIWILCACIIGGSVILLLKQIPGVKNYI